MKKLLLSIALLSTISAYSIKATTVVNNSNIPIKVYFKAWGCFGVTKDGYNCKPVDRACTHEFLVPVGGKASYSWKWGQTGRTVLIDYSSRPVITKPKKGESQIEVQPYNRGSNSMDRVQYSKKITGDETIIFKTKLISPSAGMGAAGPFERIKCYGL